MDPDVNIRTALAEPLIPAAATQAHEVICCMPLLNPGRELDLTLASFKACSVKPFLLVIDDGSKSPIKIDFGQYGLTGAVLRFERNLGISAALNAAFLLGAAAGFKYVARMDGDDLNHPDRFATQIVFLEENPNLLAAFSWANLIDAEGRELGVWRTASDRQALRQDMCANNVLIHPTAMLRREYIFEVGLFRESSRFAEDYDLFLRGVLLEKVGVIPAPLIQYRIHEGSISFAKYRWQIASRLKTQIRYLSITGLSGWRGIARSIGVLMVATLLPRTLVSRLRSSVRGRRFRTVSNPSS